MEEIIDGICNADDECLEDVLCEMAIEEFESYEARKSIQQDLWNVKDNPEKVKLLNNFFIGIFGWSFETLLNRTKEKEQERGIA